MVPGKELDDLHFCTSIPVPDYLIGEAARLAIEENPANRIAHHKLVSDLNLSDISEAPPALFLALVSGKMWRPGKVLRVSLDGASAKISQRVKYYAETWTKYANVTFNYVDVGEAAEIRVGFVPGSSWSKIGTDCLTVLSPDKTMNLGINDQTEDTWIQRHVLHEFGHALGCIHEHANPSGHIQWNKPAVYAYYKESMGWDKAQVDEDVFKQYSTTKTQFTQLDPTSVMIYPIPAALTLDGFSVGWNMDLSVTDKSFIQQSYPAKVQVFYQGGNNLGQVKVSSTNDFKSWKNAVTLDAVALCGGPTLAWLGETLYLFHQNPNGGGSVRCNILTKGGWSDDIIVANTAGMSGSPAVINYKDKLYCFYQGVGNNGRVLYNIFDGYHWSGELIVSNTAGMTNSPAAVVFNDKIYCFYQGVGGNNRNMYNVFDGVSWSGEKIVQNTAGLCESPAAAVLNGKIYLFYQAPGNNSAFMYNVFDGNAWSGDKRVPNTPGISCRPSAFTYNGAVYCFHSGAQNNCQLWFTKFDGTAWSSDAQVSGVRLSDAPWGIVAAA